MILIQLKQHIQQHRFVSLFDLASHFNVEAQILRDMLQLWIRKGKIKIMAVLYHCHDSNPLSRLVYKGPKRVLIGPFRVLF